MTDWQDIKSAPKDGTPIVLCDRRVTDCYIAVCWEENEEYPDYVWAALDQEYHLDWGTHWTPLTPPEET